MPKQTYALEVGGENRLEISWKGIWKDTTILFDGNCVGVIPNPKALSQGQEFVLLDGSTLKVQLGKNFSGLQVLRNGQAVHSSVSDLQKRVKNAYVTVFIIAGLNLISGLLTLGFKIEVLKQVGIGFGSIVFGVVFLVLGVFVKRRSNVALIFSIIIFALDGILGFILPISQVYHLGTGGLIFHFISLILMIQGVGAIKKLKRREGK